MTDTVFTQGKLIESPWLNDVNNLRYGNDDSSRGAALLKTKSTATGAVERTQASKNEEIKTPQDFGSISASSWHTVINAAATSCAANGWTLKLPPISGGYPITDTVTIPALVGVDMTGTYITYNGTRDRTAVVIGTAGVDNRYTVLKGLDVRSSTIDWATSVNYVGIKFYNLNRSPGTEVFRAEGFHIGMELFTDTTTGSAYNQIYIGDLLNNKYDQKLWGDGASAFVNENRFYGGRYGCSSAAVGLGDAWGVLVTWNKTTGYRSNNNNRWLFPCFEKIGASGVTRQPFWFDGAGSFNKVIGARNESSGGTFALCDAGTANSAGGSHNEFEITYFGGAFATDSITQSNGAVGNTYNSFTPSSKIAPVWVSPDPVMAMKPNAANTAFLTGVWSYYTNGSQAVRKTTDSTVEIGGKRGVNYVRISSSASVMGVELRLDQTRQIAVRQKSAGTANYGRLVIRVWDSAGAQLTGGTHVSSAQQGATAAAVTYNGGLFGGAYQSASDGVGKTCVLAFTSDVAVVHVGVSGGSQPAHFQGLTITDVTPAVTQGLSVFCSVGEDALGLATAKPDGFAAFGTARRGERIGNTAAAAGVAAGWACSLAEWNAVAWAITTAYVVGQIRKNGVDTYVCTVAGTSAGAGGPTGTGTGIVDNTVTWDFLGKTAIFVTEANLA